MVKIWFWYASGFKSIPKPYLNHTLTTPKPYLSHTRTMPKPCLHARRLLHSHLQLKALARQPTWLRRMRSSPPMDATRKKTATARIKNIKSTCKESKSLFYYYTPERPIAAQVHVLYALEPNTNDALGMVLVCFWYGFGNQNPCHKHTKSIPKPYKNNFKGIPKPCQNHVEIMYGMILAWFW